IQPSHVHEAGAAVLFGGPIDVEQWIHRVRQHATLLQYWTYAGTADGDALPRDASGAITGSLLPLVITRRGSTAPVDDATRVQPDDVMVMLVPRYDAGAVRDRLRANGWEPAAPATGERAGS